MKTKKKLNRRSIEPLLLASASPRRSFLLKQLGVDFEICPSSVEELSARMAHHLTPPKLALFNALHKAQDVFSKHLRRSVLAADTIVVLQGRIFGKPKDLIEAASYLKILSNKTHQVLTAVVWIRSDGKRKSFVERSNVTFRNLSEAKIKQYLKKVNVLDKAGAYAFQEKGNSIIAKVEGLHSNVIGLPIERLKFLKG